MEIKEYIREFTTRDIIKTRNPQVVTIGGGTGMSTILRGIKQYTDRITAIVTVGDDGGSSGRLREETGMLPPGDIRNCIVALADDEGIMSSLFNYRFPSGELEGHSFGNLFLAAMNGISADFYDAVKRTSEVLHIKGRVLPVTLGQMRLKAVLENGKIVSGESEIPEAALREKSPIANVFLEDEHPLKPLDETIDAILNAQIIVLGPGSLYTSLIPNLLIEGIEDAIRLSPAKKYYVANLMTQPGETDGFTQKDHLDAIRRHLDSDELLFETMIENTGSLSPALKKKYAQFGQHRVEPIEDYPGLKILSGDLISIERLNIRHDADEVARILFSDYLKGSRR